MGKKWVRIGGMTMTALLVFGAARVDPGPRPIFHQDLRIWGFATSAANSTNQTSVNFLTDNLPS